jgi:hypothetical protein
VGAVAKGLIGAVFAVAEGDGFLFFDGDFLRLEGGSFVGTIAEGLRGGFAAGAPPVVAGFEFHDGGGFAGNIRLIFGAHAISIRQRRVRWLEGSGYFIRRGGTMKGKGLAV